MDLKELENGVDPSSHWYYRSKYLPLKRYFEDLHSSTGERALTTIIDFGSGSGFFAERLLQDFPERIKKVYLVDIGYPEDMVAASKGNIVEKSHVVPEGISNALILMMDVLEHLEDPAGVLETVKARLGEEVFCFVTVPAFMSVWSTHDVFLGHYRRYTLDTLSDLLHSMGTRIDKGYYIYFSIFPLVWLLRRLKRSAAEMNNPSSSDMQPTAAPVNAILLAFHSLEMKLTRNNRWFGLTCVAEGKMK
jgi:pimeloyl-ACP methyl ester carboxylesterase